MPLPSPRIPLPIPPPSFDPSSPFCFIEGRLDVLHVLIIVFLSLCLFVFSSYCPSILYWSKTNYNNHFAAKIRFAYGLMPASSKWRWRAWPQCTNGTCRSWKWLLLRRGVRSDAQLSCRETRFQKCSQSGKNGSEHPMLSISMAFNVISCKKVERNTQKLKIADFTM